MSSVADVHGGGAADRGVEKGPSFRVLGPLAADLDGMPVALGGPKERTVLAVLIAAGGRPVTIDALADALWGDAPPATAERTLHAYVARLRKSLGSDAIITHGRGYALAAAASAVDAARFESSAAAGRAAAERGDPGGAAAAFDRALAEWTGPAFLGHDDVEACAAEARRLEQARGAVMEERFEAMLELGHAADLVADLRAAVAVEPYRERLWASLMIAEYRAGRRADALRSYQEARRLLVDGVGVEPGPHLRRIEAAVLADDPDVNGSPADEPLIALPALLDPGGSACVSREHELARIRQAWARACNGAGQLFSITGPEGSGKTRLAAELAGEVHAGGGVVACARSDADHRTGRSVLDQALRSAGGSLLAAQAAAPPGESLGSAVARLLARWSQRRPVLLVLDDLHAAEDDVLTLVADVAAGVTSAAVLVVAVFRSDNLDGDSGTNQVVLRELPREGVVSVCQIYGDDWTGAEVDALMAATGGWPLAVHEAAAARARQASGRRAGLAAESARQAEQRLNASQEALIDEVVGMRRSARTRRRELRTRPLDGGSVGDPFRGLAPFDREHGVWFFGRDAAVAEIVAELAAHPAVAVVGASGSGKSSLVRAGVLPALADGALPGSAEWDPVVLTPGSDPVATLRAAVGEARGQRRLLVVDQFEELFAATNAQTRSEFAELLFEHVANGNQSIVVMRADQVAQLAELPAIATLVSGHTVLVAPMREAGLREAIERPLEVAGLRAEDGLVETILADARGSREVLPLLQTALLATWERRVGDRLTVDGYRESGGVAGAIARLAEEMYAGLSPTQAAAARRIFVRLVDVDRGASFDLRRRVRRQELVGTGERPDDAAAAEALAAAVRHRLIVLDADTVEITHEALVREWPRLTRWVEDDREGLRLHQRLGDSARAWIAAGRDPSELLRGARLEAVDDWASRNAGHLNDAERELVAASRAAALAELAEVERRAAEQARAAARLRRRLVLAGGLLVLALAATSVAAWQWQRQRESAARAGESEELAAAEASAALEAKAEAERAQLSAEDAQQDAERAQQDAEQQADRALAAEDTAEAAQRTSDARRLAAEALVDQRIDRALLSAVAGVRLDERPETRAGLVAAMQRAPLATLIARLPNGNRPQAIAISPDGRLLAVPDNAGLVHLLDAGTLEERAVIEGGWGVRFLDDGRLVMAEADSSGIIVTDPFQPDHDRPLTGGSIPATFLDSDPSGSRVVADVVDGARGVVAWDVGTPDEPTGTYNYGDTVRGVALVDQGRSAVIVGTGAEPAQIVELASGRVTASFAGGTALALDRERTVLATASGSDHRTLLLYEVGSSQPIRSIGVPSAVTALAMSPDGEHIAVGMSGGTELYRTDGTFLLRLDGQAEVSRGLVFAPDGGMVFGTSLDGTVVRWDVTGTDAGFHWRALTDGLFAPTDWTGPVYISPRGDIAMPVHDGTRGDVLVVAGAESGVRLRWFTEHRLPQWPGAINAVAWAPDGATLATGSGDARVRLWDAVTGEQLAEWEAPLARSVMSAAFDRTGQRLVVGLSNDTLPTDAEPGPDVAVLDAASLEPIDWYEVSDMRDAPYRASVFRVAVDPSGTHVLLACCGGESTQVTSMALDDGQPAWTIESDAGPSSFAFSPDGDLLALVWGDGTITVVRASDGTTVAGPVRAHDGWADSVAFSPDGAILASGGTDGLVRVWRVADLASLGTYDLAAGREQTSVVAVFDDDGSRLLVYQGTKLWDVPVTLDEIVTQACTAVGRDLTREEWSSLVPDQPYQPTCP